MKVVYRLPMQNYADVDAYALCHLYGSCLKTVGEKAPFNWGKVRGGG